MLLLAFFYVSGARGLGKEESGSVRERRHHLFKTHSLDCYISSAAAAPPGFPLLLFLMRISYANGKDALRALSHVISLHPFFSFLFLVFFFFFFLKHSPALRHYFRSRDDHHPTDDVRHGQVPRDAQQRPGVYEAKRSTAGPVRARHGLRRLYLGHVQRPGHLHGTYEMPPAPPRMNPPILLH